MPAFLALGCMNFGKRTPEGESLAILARAIASGVTVLDTANVYNTGESERLVGRALAALTPYERGRVQVHTKCGLAGMEKGQPEGLSPAAVRAAVDASLSRLGVERVDVLYLHAPDAKTPIADTLAAVAELQKAGKVSDLGISNYAAWQILEMLPICEQVGARRPVISQVIYNVLIRQIEVEYLRFAAAYGLHTTVYNPVAGGLLARADDPRQGIPAGSRFAQNKMYVRRYWTDVMHDTVAALRAAADSFGHTTHDLAYAWLRERPGVGSVLIGPGSLAHLDAALAAWQRPVPPELLARADEIWAEMVGTDARYAR